MATQVSNHARQGENPLAVAWATLQHSLQTRHNPFRGLAVPERRDRSFFPLSCHQSRECGRKLARIRPDELVRADRDGFRAFGGVSQAQPWSWKHVWKVCYAPLVLSLFKR